VGRTIPAVLGVARATLGLVASTTVVLAFSPPALYARFMAPRLTGAHPARRAAEGEPG